MHVFSGVLDEDFLVELLPKSIAEHVIFKIFLAACPQTPLALACFACWLCFAQHTVHRSQDATFKLAISVH